MSKERELLRLVVHEITAYGQVTYKTLEHIENFLAAESEAEPVAWTSQDELNALGTDVTCYMYSEPMMCENNIPLYTRPEPARKPMTDREIMDLAKSLGFDEISTMDFAIGFRYAEKHHGITASDLTLQDQCRGDKL